MITDFANDILAYATDKVNVWWTSIPVTTKVTLAMTLILVIIGIFFLKKLAGLIATAVVIGGTIYVSITYTGLSGVWFLMFPSWNDIAIWNQLIILFFVGSMTYTTVLFARGLRKDHRMRTNIRIQKDLKSMCKKMGGTWHPYGRDRCQIPDKR